MFRKPPPWDSVEDAMRYSKKTVKFSFIARCYMAYWHFRHWYLCKYGFHWHRKLGQCRYCEHFKTKAS
jgi:hypothetical protein